MGILALAEVRYFIKSTINHIFDSLGFWQGKLVLLCYEDNV